MIHYIMLILFLVYFELILEKKKKEFRFEFSSLKKNSLGVITYQIFFIFFLLFIASKINFLFFYCAYRYCIKIRSLHLKKHSMYLYCGYFSKYKLIFFSDVYLCLMKNPLVMFLCCYFFWFLIPFSLVNFFFNPLETQKNYNEAIWGHSDGLKIIITDVGKFKLSEYARHLIFGFSKFKFHNSQFGDQTKISLGFFFFTDYKFESSFYDEMSFNKCL